MIVDKHTKKNINQCYQECPHFYTDMDGMHCGHSYWKNKGAYEDMIITQENSRGKFPSKCPLFKKEDKFEDYEL